MTNIKKIKKKHYFYSGVNLGEATFGLGIYSVNKLNIKSGGILYLISVPAAPEPP